MLFLTASHSESGSINKYRESATFFLIFFFLFFCPKKMLRSVTVTNAEDNMLPKYFFLHFQGIVATFYR